MEFAFCTMIRTFKIILLLCWLFHIILFFTDAHSQTFSLIFNVFTSSNAIKITFSIAMISPTFFSANSNVFYAIFFVTIAAFEAF